MLTVPETVPDDASVPGIPVRDMPFEFGEVPCVWNERFPERCYKTHALSIALPYLEPYFIATIKEAVAEIDDDALRARALAFCAQEAHHSRQHIRFNRALRKSGYPGLERFEKQIQQSLVQSRANDSLAVRLAYTAGFEALTFHMAKFMLERTAEVFESSPPELTALWIWHAVEEVEHKTVAFDVFQAYHGGYWLRCRGLYAAMKKTIHDMMGPVEYMVEQDGRADDKELRRRFRTDTRRDLKVLPSLLAYLRPSYHPSQHDDPPLAARWQRAYESGAKQLQLTEADLAPSRSTAL